jgi:hypothetical protein
MLPSNIVYYHQSKRLWAASIHTSKPYTIQYSLDALHDYQQITKRYGDLLEHPRRAIRKSGSFNPISRYDILIRQRLTVVCLDHRCKISTLNSFLSPGKRTPIVRLIELCIAQRPSKSSRRRCEIADGGHSTYVLQ